MPFGQYNNTGPRRGQPNMATPMGPNSYGGMNYGGNYAGSGQYSDQDYFKGQTFYDPSDPNTAFDSALRDYGINPFAANPYTQTLRRNAQPLSSAYMADAALWGDPQSNYGGNGVRDGFADPLQASLYPYQYAHYMQGALRGTGSNQQQQRWDQQFGSGDAPVQNPTFSNVGGLYNRLATGASQLPALVNRIRQANMDQSGNIMAGNPFLDTMAERLADNNGMGTVNFMTEMQSPLMSPALRQAYRNRLVQQQSMAMRQYGNQADPGGGNDIWHYLLGQ
jgi:hypothetical protein